MRVTVHVPDPLGEEAEQIAASKGVSVSSLYAEAVARHLQTLKREEAFRELDKLVGAPVAPDFDEQLAALRRDKLER